QGNATGRYRLVTLNASVPQPGARRAGPFAPTPRYAPGTDLSAPAPEGMANPSHGGFAAPAAATRPQAAGDVVATFVAGIHLYGLGLDRGAGDLWLGSLLAARRAGLP